MFQSPKERMKEAGITQAQMILELQKRGIKVQPPEMSQVLSGVNTYPKAKHILAMVGEVLDEMLHE